jgi:hypothetical protein
LSHSHTKTSFLDLSQHSLDDRCAPPNHQGS